MIAVRMVRVAFDQVIDVIAVRHRGVAAIGAVLVGLGVGAAVVVRLIWSRGNNRPVETTEHPQGPEGPEEGEA